MKADTTFADELARQQTQQCIRESQACARAIGDLAADPNLWTIESGSFSGDQTGGIQYQWTKDGNLAGGTITVDGNLGKYSRVTNKYGFEVAYRTTLTHEVGHVRGNLKLQKTGRITPERHCNEPCAVEYENEYRREMGYTELQHTP